MTCRTSVFTTLILFFWGAVNGNAQEAFPSWSATKRVPTTSTRATYPAIVEEGDTLHVVFRATFTSGTDPDDIEAILDPEILLDRIQTVDFMIRNANETQLEMVGGREKLKEQRKELNEQLRKAQENRSSRLTQSTAPVQTAIYYTRSEDRGRTFWEKPVAITKRGEIFYGQTAMALNDEGIHVVYTADAGNNVIQLFSIKSADGGETWSQPSQISTSEFHARDPYLVALPGGGLFVCWWEKEETESEGRRQVDFNLMEELHRNVHVEGRDPQTNIESMIRYSRYVAENWQGEKLLTNMRGVPPAVNASLGPNGEIYVYWSEERGPRMMESKNGGVTWDPTIDFAQILDRDRSTIFLHDGKEYHFIQGDPQLNKAGPLFHREGMLFGEWKQIVQEHAMHSFPRIDYTKDEVQVVWGTTDQTGNHILYFREDNKPPTSELQYPPDGDFTKHAHVFLWRGVDDIATRLTYRRCVEKRKSPDERTPPFNWSLYEALDEYAIEPLDDGYYTLYVQATDFSGNEEVEPSAFDFQTWYVPPGVKADSKTLPPIEIETRNIEIKWDAKDNSTTDKEPLIAYRLDGNPVTAFAPRESVKITGLRAGWHQVQLYGMDENGNISPFGDTVSVSVKLSLQLFWKQIPVQPKQDDTVFVMEDRVNLAWGVQENTKDKGINYLSSMRRVHEGNEGPWEAPDYNQTAELSGPDNSPLDEGGYIIQILAQDEFGNRIENPIACQFTVDHTPPEILFNEPTINPENKIPTVSVSGEDNYSHPQNILYQFRIKEGEELGQWSTWSGNASFVCADHPIKWYSWGYEVQARAKDVAGNVMQAPVTHSLLWWVRNPWMLYSLIGIGVLLVLGILFIIISSLIERSRAKKRAAARRRALEEAAPPAEGEEPQPADGGDDLFEVPGTADTSPAGEEDLFGGGPVAPSSPGMGVTEPAPEPSFTDPFSTGESSADTAVFDDPFAEKEEPAPSGDILEDEAPVTDLFEEEEEPPPLEIVPPTDTEPADGSESAEDAGEEPPAAEKKAEEKPRTWSPDEDVTLDDQDLFKPLDE